MTGFEILINEKLICTVGVSDVGVLIASLELGRRDSHENHHDHLKLRVGGSESIDGHLKLLDWLNRQVSVGDVVTIRIVEVSQSDKPKNIESLE